MKYKITRHGSDYVLWKNVETEHGVGCFKIVSGTKEECKQKLEELNGTGTRKTKSKKQRVRRKQSSTSRKNKTAEKRDKKQR